MDPSNDHNHAKVKDADDQDSEKKEKKKDARKKQRKRKQQKVRDLADQQESESKDQKREVEKKQPEKKEIKGQLETEPSNSLMLPPSASIVEIKADEQITHLPKATSPKPSLEKELSTSLVLLEDHYKEPAEKYIEQETKETIKGSPPAHVSTTPLNSFTLDKEETVEDLGWNFVGAKKRQPINTGGSSGPSKVVRAAVHNPIAQNQVSSVQQRQLGSNKQVGNFHSVDLPSLTSITGPNPKASAYEGLISGIS